METKYKQCQKTDFSGITVYCRLINPLEMINTQILFTLMLLFFLALNSWSASGQSNCLADFEVYKGRNVRSSPLDGTYYTLTINNRGQLATSFILSAENINATCSNTDGTTSKGNVEVKANFMDLNRNPIGEISVNSGQTAKFLVHITVPQGTPINKWCCTQVVAKSTRCTNYSVNTVLHTLIINSSEE